ncbi:MAG TPA: OmpA family protein [Accumulibacter sp.]|nr:OmpA family protein [Accumulibacter sp.]HMW17353.1 OmpA family protein [Accumulibacter sp.]HMX21959.1 OmpA family protein [Accumulibacter sp.]HMY06496.1 OmpA family protein [Accumulibacter sp.]HNC17142.1 OmpA family protein [Accumulibacter sp.]
MKQLHRFAVISLSALALAACNTTPPQQQTTAGPGGCKPLGGTQQTTTANSNTTNAAIGAVAGGVLGAVVGRSVANRSSVGTRNGLLLGALAGGLAGSQYNKMIGMTEQNDGSVKLNIPGSVMFSTGSATISPAFASTLDSVAGTIKEYCGLTATVTGHTDNTGTVEGNRRLSEDRARSVANYLVSRGVDPMRLQQAGRGQNEPIATNATEEGRAQNRRVEIFVRPPAS